MTKLHKVVLMPITVPNNPACWDGNTPCEHFDNEGGYPECTLGIYIPLHHKWVDGIGYPKPAECEALKEVDCDE